MQNNWFDSSPNMDGTWSSKWDYREQQTGIRDVIPMWVADMDFDTAPAIKQAVIERAGHGVYGYTQVDQAYLTALQTWLEKRCCWEIDTRWISHTPGVICAIHTAVHAFSNPGDAVLIQPPVYHPFYRVMERTGRRILENPLIDNGTCYELDLQHFEAVIKTDKPKIFLLCNPHNPVGKVFSREELAAMGDICNRYNVLVISDEIHSDLTLPGVPHVPFGSLGQGYADNCIVCTAPSKTFNLAGLQLSNIIIPDGELRKQYTAKFEEAGIPQRPNLFALTAATAAYQSGAQWLDEARAYLLENRHFAEAFFQQYLPQLQPYHADGTYFLWLDCRKLDLPDKQLEHFFVQSARVWFNQGHTFGSQGSGFVRINLACPRKLLQEALQRILTAVEQL